MRQVILVAVFAAGLLAAVNVAWCGEGYDEGRARYFRGDYRGAIATLKTYVAQTPDPRAMYLIGYASYELGDYESARKYFRDAYLVDPKFDPALTGLKMR